MTLHDLRAKRQRIIEIANRNRAANIRVFGSVSRNEATEASDVDFLVSFMPGATLLDQVGLIEELQIELGQAVDVVSDRALNRHLRDRILKEAQPL
jgi:predicted nucleotidyltransferase